MTIANTRELGDIADIHVGYQARSRIIEDPNAKYRLIQGKDFNDYSILDTSSLIRFNPDERSSINNSVSSGSILFQARGSKHFAYHVSEPLEFTLVSSTFYVLNKFVDDIAPGYIAWWLNKDRTKDFFYRNASRSSVSFVSTRTLSEMSIPLPPFEIQKKIEEAGVLWRKEYWLRIKLDELRKKLVEAYCIKQSKVRI